MTAMGNSGLSLVAGLTQPGPEPGAEIDGAIRFEGVAKHADPCVHDLGCAVGPHSMPDREIRVGVWAALVPRELACITTFRSSSGNTQYCAATEAASPAAARALGIYS